MMATLLPPRKNPTPTKLSRQHLSPLQILLQMGFPKHRAEKALAATGHRGVQLASDWLLAHVNDTTLDMDQPREYVVYLCPTGTLYEQIQAFWDDSLQKCGWNGAHNLVPHITLCSFFKCGDESCEALVSVLKEVVHGLLPSLPPSLTLDKYISTNYMGLFLTEHQEDTLKKLAMAFVKEASHLCSSGEMASKALHLTLAYQFPVSQFPRLEALGEALEQRASATWEVRLYSRDTRILTNEVHKVLYSHVSRDPDELELLIGDFVYVKGDTLAASPDGWVEGTSWLTGSTGFLPINYIERTAESDAWTLHKSIPVIGTGGRESVDSLPNRPPISLSLLNLLENSEGSRRSTEVVSESSSMDRLHSRQASLEATHSPPLHKPEDLDALYAKVKKPKKEGPLYQFPIQGPRKVIVVRHGERVDFTFGDWIRFCFDEADHYQRRDLNMPESLPERAGAPNSFYKDCPLTQVGLLQASLVGSAMQGSGIEVHHVFCSPSLRCVQTFGHSEHMPLNIEPGLFEWLAWYHDGMPVWMTLDELTATGFNINHSYDPLICREELKDTHESCEQYYGRNAYVSQSIINTTQAQGGTVLLVGHAATLDTCTRQLVGGAPRSAHEMTSIIKKVPYGCTALVGQDEAQLWRLLPPCVMPVTFHGIMIPYCSTSAVVQEPPGLWSLVELVWPVSNTGRQHYDWRILLT
ncbi:Ubiquitin-associated and SH3 domain-containing protein B [Chionoecetes opilio]|uniref:Ecdysteroid-phosphate phosphatase n=1 Tax=Chionoecetes opilio TaxID=41210 RepID=A0A8J4XPH1_CHIOP|nr:Ubiquitin-associated and SH3 domain-containing protein B [Chionoecetes opilio]